MPIIIDELPKDGFVKVLMPVPSTVIGDGSVHVPTTDALVEPGEIIILVNDRRGIVALRPGANPPIKVLTSWQIAAYIVTLYQSLLSLRLSLKADKFF